MPLSNISLPEEPRSLRDHFPKQIAKRFPESAVSSHRQLSQKEIQMEYPPAIVQTGSGRVYLGKLIKHDPGDRYVMLTQCQQIDLNTHDNFFPLFNLAKNGTEKRSLLTTNPVVSATISDIYLLVLMTEKAVEKRRLVDTVGVY